jgi:uncharacterized membrane protein required for colicin V production
MNSVDVALSFLLLACALRGYWRGVFRESFGLAALVAAVVAAFECTVPAAAVLQEYLPLPSPLDSGLAFVGLFVIVQSTVNLLGVLLDRTAGAVVPGLVRIAGALFGMGKAAAAVAFVLLFVHLFPVLPGLDERIMSSRLGRPLLALASSVTRVAAEHGASEAAGS